MCVCFERWIYDDCADECNLNDYAAAITAAPLATSLTVTHSIKGNIMQNHDAFVKAINFLNERHYARVLLFAAPGVLLNKLATAVNAPSAFQVASAGVLGGGIVMYVCWARIYSRLVDAPAAQHEEAQETEQYSVEQAPSIPGQIHVDLMSELVEMSNGSAQDALNLVAKELQVNPTVTYPAAIELAHRRRDLDIKNRSGN